MNIKITHKWLLDYIDTDITPEELQKYLSLCGPSIERIEKVGNEIVYDIEITTNRVDTASVMGIARECAAILNRFGKKAVIKKVSIPSIPPPQTTAPITIIDKEGLCKRILGIVMEVDEVHPSPQYIQDRLNAVGIRVINNLVDITNYVMVEVGHPTHVFDYDRITTHNLIVRHAKKNEEIITLDEKKYNLSETDIIIDDGTGKVIDLPGIMGTANSVVTNDTKRILFFIDSNDPVSIRRSSMKYGIRTMASTINEKSPDPELALIAFKRGVQLYKEVAKAKPLSTLTDLYPNPVHTSTISVTKEFIDKKVGIEIPLETVISILRDLEFGVSVKGETLLITVPTYRITDVSIPEDIVEEVARVYGYFSLPSVLQKSVYIQQPHEEETLFTYQNSIKMYLKHMGYSEVMNYSATSLEVLKAFDMDKLDYLHITNSISEDIKYLRRSLIPSLVKNIKQNEGFEKELRLFEVAKTYIPEKNKLPIERFKLTIAVNTTFADLKGIIDGLLHELNINAHFVSIEKNGIIHPFAEDAQGAIGIKSIIGTYGLVKSQFTHNLHLEQSVFAAEFDFMELISLAKQMPQYKPFSQNALISLDLTINKNKSFAEMRKIAFESAPHLISFELKDSYKNTITLRFTFTDTKKNLTEKEAQEELIKIQKVLE